MRGSIRQRGPKVWQVRVSLGKDPDTGRYHYAQRYVNGGKRDAQRASAELVAEIDRGGYRQRGRHTVEELLGRWMAHIENQGRAPSTLVRYRSAIDVNIKPRLGRVEIAKVDGATLDAFYGQLQRAGLSALTVRKSHAILSAAFSQAIRWAGSISTRSCEPRRRHREDARSIRPASTSCAGSSTPAPRTP
ncbi:MAG: hypothetical protein ACRDY0_03280 [Acidimicrobiales bacterium]